ncbi:TonB-dependent receptor domain-containing protein [Allopontixanthobacter sp.]|uniref:TonB-dependent receptor domain-containing protein n=1 Tax=Allopontixanthobacter sp. TaxID=2906452 RepID=UPI002AB9A3A0|nr:TonB-dependent receptor [Allopontixanthobacter sp.]MDZ4307565.1 TonB-dependent receptor [Allopontixanthobacter sp.]
MKKFDECTLKTLAGSVSALALILSAPVAAQDQDSQTGEVSPGDAEQAPADVTSGVDEERAPEGAIVVTGSRIQRTDTYSSISPLQVLETERLRDAGEFDAASILQQSESAAGTQIDATFQGFVLNNGPGSQTLDLRGLGADRTLLLVNGRRLAPAGVEGAPTNPSINLIPSSLVARYDLLLDGASSVYGSDAVAGVGNIILRNDFEGLELDVSGDYNEQGAGHDYRISGAWGKSGSNWNFGIGAEYQRRDEVTFGDRDFLAGCNTHYEITDSGEIRTLGISDDANTRRLSGGAISENLSPCTVDAAVRRIIPNSPLFFSSIYYDETVFASTGQAGNTGIPNFSDALDAFGDPVDRNGDGLLDVDFSQVTRNGTDLTPSFISPQDLYNVMAYGEYTFGGDLGITPFFEANYSRAEVTARSQQPQLFPFVPGSNPFNPCNIANNDCGAANNSFDGLDTFGGGAFARPTGVSYTVRPVVGVTGDRNVVETVQEQYRGVFGLKGNLPFIKLASDNDWTFEISGVYSRSEGKSSRAGIRNDRLALALGMDPTVSNPTGRATPVVLAGGACATSGFANPELLQPDVVAGCVPVNLFAPSLFRTAVGDFASQAERDYLFDTRDFDTTYEQTILSTYVQGSLFELAGGTAKAVIGGEYRKDKLNSIPDLVASEGLFFGFFADQGAQGSKEVYEAFGELDLPLMAGRTLVEDLRVNLSGRITKDEFYGTNETYSIKFGWRPIEQLLIKSSYGTSFRSPNLRELFLAGQSGFGNILDPCAVPTVAFAPLAGGYIAANDTRDPFVLANCVREGRDPTVVGTDGATAIQTASVEITSGGSFELDPETSRSLTAGFSFAEGFGPVDFNFNFNYYDIKVKGAIAEPTGQFIVNQCFLRDEDTRSNFCDFVDFDTDLASRQLITDVFAGFVNINEEAVRGIDLNADFSTDVQAFGKTIDLGLNLRANHLIQRDSVFLTDLGERTVDEDAGDFGFPSWTGRAILSARVDNVSFTWQTRYIGPVEQQEDGIDPLSDAFGRGPDGAPTGFIGNTCLGNGSGTFNAATGVFTPDGVVPGDGVFCRDIGFAGDYFVSNASVRVRFDRFDVRVGVSNIFDKKPPLIDTNEVFGISNTPIGNGYDLNGREFFGSIGVKF